jgi:hypothetical protein
MSAQLKRVLDEAYESMEGSEVAEGYMGRHGIQSLGILTVTDDESADAIVRYLAPRIEGKTVVEIGAGIGLLAMHLGFVAKRVFAIEVDPMWSSVFVMELFAKKPKNVSFLMGAADEFAGIVKADVALFCTHSGVAEMARAARLFAPVVIDVYGNLRGEAQR